RKLRCWISSRDVQVGKDYAKSIVEAIQGSRLMIVILSEFANRSNHVRIEVERGFNRDLILLPFRVNDIKPEQSLEYFLSANQWLDATNGKPADHFESLYQHCADLLGIDKTKDVPVVKEEPPAPQPPKAEPTENSIIPPVIEPQVVVPVPKPDAPPPPAAVVPPLQEMKLPPPPTPPAFKPRAHNYPPKPGSNKGLLLAASIIGGLILLFFLYHAFFQKHTITFINYTQTPVYIELDGQLTTVQPGGRYDYKARNQYRLKTNANTYVLNNNGHIIGQTMEWQIDTVINSWKNIEYPLNIAPGYFLMQVVNNSPARVTYLKVSAGSINYLYDFNDTYIPNNGTKYNLGYFRALSDLNVYMSDANGRHLEWNAGSNLGFINSDNQYIDFTYKY
ncbi:MAG: toll/interleukin-1 receptor domain-containing protein, partial [Mucilaginibacter sp.]